MVVFCCYTVRITRGQKMAVHSTQGQNRAVRSTQGGGGVTLRELSRRKPPSRVGQYMYTCKLRT